MRVRLGKRAVRALVLTGWFLGGCAAPASLVSDPLARADRRMLAETVQRALEKNKVGQGTNWRGPESGVRGTVTPTRTFRTFSADHCRDYQATRTLGDDTGFAYGTACRGTDG